MNNTKTKVLIDRKQLVYMLKHNYDWAGFDIQKYEFETMEIARKIGELVKSHKQIEKIRYELTK